MSSQVPGGKQQEQKQDQEQMKPRVQVQEGDDELDGDGDDSSKEVDVPESLRALFEEADQQLQQNIREVIGEDQLGGAAVQLDCEEGDSDVHEGAALPAASINTSTVTSKGKGTGSREIQTLAKEDAQFFSPDIWIPPSSINPAAHLTHNTARNQALQGSSPYSPQERAGAVKNLNMQLEQALIGVHQEVQVQAQARAPSGSNFATGAYDTSHEESIGSQGLGHRNTNHQNLGTKLPPNTLHLEHLDTHNKTTPASAETPPQMNSHQIGAIIGLMDDQEQNQEEPPSPQRPLEICFEQNTDSILLNHKAHHHVSNVNDANSPLGMETATTPSPTRKYRPSKIRPVTRVHTGSPGTTMSPRLLQSTQACSSKYGRNRIIQPEPTTQQTTRGRKELTSPLKISGRLLQGTASSQARATNNADDKSIQQTRDRAVQRNREKPMSPRLLQHTYASQAYLANTPTKLMRTDMKCQKMQTTSRETKEQAGKHLQCRQRKEESSQRKCLDQKKNLQQQQQEKQQKMRMTFERTRKRRELQQRKEEERRERLRLQLEEKQAKAQQRLKRSQAKLRQETTKAKTISLSPLRRASKCPPYQPTIPKAFSFRTASRVKSNHSTNAHRDGTEECTLAQSDTILQRNLRGATATAHSSISVILPDFTQRPLTIPRGPRLSTSRSRGCSSISTKKDVEPHRNQKTTPRRSPLSWEQALRHAASSPSEKTTLSAASSKLTIPQTPRFHEMKQRPRPKSTAEKEVEEMEFFRSHPFKAKPVQMNSVDNLPVNKPPPVRRLTTPSPFTFRVEQRLATSTRKNVSVKESNSLSTQLFKAKPTPNFKSTLTGSQSMPQRSLKGLRSSEAEPAKELGSATFKARPMPNFRKHSGLEFQRQKPVHKKESSQEGEKIPSSFRARPMPDFSRLSMDVRQQQQGPGRRIPCQQTAHHEGTQPFRARKLPNCISSPPLLQVKQRDPSKLRSADGRRFSKENEEPRPALTESPPIPISTGFKARPMPKFSPPRLPVRDRDPTKLHDVLLTPLESFASTTPSLAYRAPAPIHPTTPSPSRSTPRTTPTLSSPKWARRTETTKQHEPDETELKMCTKERLCQRQNDRGQTAASDANKKFFSANARSRLEHISSTTTDDPKFHVDVHDKAFASHGPRFYSEDHVDVAKRCGPNHSSPQAGKVAATLTVNDNNSASKRREQERDAAEKLGLAMRMACDLQRAAEDELSYHSSRHSRDVYSGYGDGSLGSRSEMFPS